MNPDKICVRFASKGAKISLSILRDKPYDDYVWIEADSLGLEFLGRLLLAHAKWDECGFHMAPHGPGSALFKRSSKFGLFIHRLPCPLPKGVHIGQGKLRARIGGYRTQRSRRPSGVS